MSLPDTTRKYNISHKPHSHPNDKHRCLTADWQLKQNWHKQLKKLT